jgi:hypothetical protein
VAAIRTDCARFLTANLDALEEFGDLTGRDAAAWGHDLWLTRNYHGAGYWDRYMEAATQEGRKRAADLGNALTDAAKALGESDLYAGDDRALYITPIPEAPSADDMGAADGLGRS